MVCPCIIIPVITVLGISFSKDQLVIGLLLTIFSLTLYLHYTEFSGCQQCS